VILLRSRAGSASLLVLDSVSETPELIWTAVMQDELRRCIVELFSSRAEEENLSDGGRVVDFPIDYVSVVYRQLVDEIYIGGVYIRLFLKQPTYKLSNPVLFAEKLVEFWESSFKLQISTSTDSGAVLMLFDNHFRFSLHYFQESQIVLLWSWHKVTYWCSSPRALSVW